MPAGLTRLYQKQSPYVNHGYNLTPLNFLMSNVTRSGQRPSTGDFPMGSSLVLPWLFFLTHSTIYNRKHDAWKSLVIPQGLNDTPFSMSSPLLNLPNELIIEIFNMLDVMDQIALVLSCKHLLTFSTTIPIRVPIPSHGNNPYCPTMKDMLRRVRPLNKNGQPSFNWGFCCTCIKYRPTMKMYWESKHEDLARVSEWRNKLQWWKRDGSKRNQCPDCWLKDNKDLPRIKQEESEVKSEVKEEEKKVLEVADLLSWGGSPCVPCLLINTTFPYHLWS